MVPRRGFDRYEGTSRGLTSSGTTMEDTTLDYEGRFSGRRSLRGSTTPVGAPVVALSGFTHGPERERRPDRPREGGEAEPVVRERGRVGSFFSPTAGSLALCR
jgi:hypothetical protein